MGESPSALMASARPVPKFGLDAECEFSGSGEAACVRVPGMPDVEAMREKAAECDASM